MLREGMKETEVIVMEQYWVLQVSVTGVKRLLVAQRAKDFHWSCFFVHSQF